MAPALETAKGLSDRPSPASDFSPKWRFSMDSEASFRKAMSSSFVMAAPESAISSSTLPPPRPSP